MVQWAYLVSFFRVLRVVQGIQRHKNMGGAFSRIYECVAIGGCTCGTTRVFNVRHNSIHSVICGRDFFIHYVIHP